MPRTASENGRVELRLRPEDKAVLARAAAIARMDLTGYILRTVMSEAEAVVARDEHLALSERDSLHVLALLEDPPPAPARLLRAASGGSPLE